MDQRHIHMCHRAVAWTSNVTYIRLWVLMLLLYFLFVKGTSTFEVYFFQVLVKVTTQHASNMNMILLSQLRSCYTITFKIETQT